MLRIREEASADALSTMRPRFMTATSSAMASATARSWEMNT